MTPEWLDWGSLGLLALVLLAIGGGAREWLKRQAERDAARDTWMRGLMEQYRQDGERHQAALQAIIKENTAVNQAQTQAMTSLCESMREHEKRAERRHNTIIETIRVANGKVAR